jgi:NADH-quinone oxidoreductase subunit G
MAVIHVDGKQYEVNGADHLLSACLSLGLDIPYFCWHPALGSVGSCRACAVKQYNNAEDAAAGRGRIVMSCMTPSTDNTWISIDDEEAKAFRASVVEWLMTNHPHDCPVCEEGGHCHLQDMTVMTGHDRRRYRFTKRTHHNQELGPFISHEMNRCIACYRCVRYYKDYAGGTDLGVFSSASNVYFGRETDGVLDSEFSGNLVEVCPTGVFTDKTHSARYNRKWDMQYAPSVCQQCSVGCNTSPGERYGELRRIENRFNGAVNHYFLCDRGRFGYGYVNLPDRPKAPQQNGQTVSVDQALDQTIASLQGKKILGIGSARASLEANFALRELVGSAQFSTGMTAAEQALVEQAADLLQTEGVQTPSLRDIEDCDFVLVLGEDVTQTAPRIALAIRQVAHNKAEQMAAERKTQDWLAEPVNRIGQHAKSPVYLLAVTGTRLHDVAAGEVVATPHDIARLGFAVAAAVAGQPVTDLSAEAVAFAQQIATDLKAAKKPLIVTGTTLLEPALLEAAAELVRVSAAQLSLVVPEVNSMGLALMGGQPLENALEGQYDAVVVLENDLTRRLSGAALEQVLGHPQLIVLDHQRTDTAKRARVLLPAASFAEGDGTVVSNEGRAQRYFQVYDPAYYNPEVSIKESWRWLHALKAGVDGRPVEWTQLDEVVAALVRQLPRLEGIREAAPDAGYRVQGLKIAREPRRYSGRTSMRAPLSVHEPRAPQDQDSALTFSMEGYVGPQENSALIPFAWAPGWNSPQSWNKFQDEVGGHLKAGDPGVRLFDRLPKRPARSHVMPLAEQAPQGSGLSWVPVYNIHASDELAARSPVMQSRMAAPQLLVQSELAARKGWQAGQTVSVQLGDARQLLSVQPVEQLPEGCVGYPVQAGQVLDRRAVLQVELAGAPVAAGVGG